MLERDLLRPAILANFGWRVLRVLTKDWYEKRDVALDRLLHDIEREDEAPVAMEAEAHDEVDVMPEPEVVAEPALVPEPPQIETARLPDVAPAGDVGNPTFARRFELVDGGSNKFWEIRVENTEQTVHFGRIGTSGQIKTKTFADESAAWMETEKLIREKLRKGYREVHGD